MNRRQLLDLSALPGWGDALATLPIHCSDILRYRAAGATQEEAARHFGISRERLALRENKGHRMLFHPSRQTMLARR